MEGSENSSELHNLVDKSLEINLDSDSDSNSESEQNDHCNISVKYS